MLPSYRRSNAVFGGRSAVPLSTLTAILALATLLSGWGMWSARSQVADLVQKLGRLETEHLQAEERARQFKSTYQHCESQYHSINKQLMDASRNLRTLEQQSLNDKTEKASAEMECQRRVDEARDRIAYEKEVNGALEKHIRHLEEAHRNREVDWHDLAHKWRKYEEDAIAENHRLLAELQTAKNLEVPTVFKDGELPLEEPQDRVEAHFDAELKLPEYHQGQHYHGHPPPPQQQQEQHQQQQQPPQEWQSPQPQQEHSQPDARQPDMPRHHADIYNHHYDEWGHEEPLDPLDSYWVNDGVPHDHNHYRAEHYHPYDHYHYEEHPGNHHQEHEAAHYEWPDLPPAPPGHHEEWHQEEQQQQQGVHQGAAHHQGAHAPDWGHGDARSNPGWHAGSHEHGHGHQQQQQHHAAPVHEEQGQWQAEGRQQGGQGQQGGHDHQRYPS